VRHQETYAEGKKPTSDAREKRADGESLRLHGHHVKAVAGGRQLDVAHHHEGAP
jgi:hypothetical protein